MNIRVIEDASPYYIRFVHDGAQELMDDVRALVKSGPTFQHQRLSREIGLDLLDQVPKSKTLNLNPDRVSLFVTPPGFTYGPHKDGKDMMFGLNYHVSIADELCTTSWYSDEELYEYEKLDGQFSRELKDVKLWKHRPLKSVVFRPGECSLLNVDYYHAFDNSASENERVVLTFRDVPPRLSFEAAKHILFGL